MPISVEQWRVATGLVNARYAPCPVRSAASPRKYLSRGTLFLRACVAVLQALLILALDTDWWGPWVGSVRGHSVREPVEIVVVHLHVSGSEGQSSVRFYVPALRILLIIAGDVEENPGPPKHEVSRLEVRHLRVIRDELAEVSRKWYDIGLELDLHPDTLETIQQQETSLPVCLRQMLMQLLKRKEPPPTWEALATALESRSVGEGHLAEQLREKYCHEQIKGEDRGKVEAVEMSEQVAEAVERKRKKEGDSEVSDVKRKCPTSILDQPFAHSSEKQLDSHGIQDETSGAHASSSVPPLHSTVPAPPPALPPMDEYASYLESFYMSKKLPTYSKWPPTSSKKYIHLAVVKKQRVSKQTADKFTRATIHGNIDDILHKKEPVDFSKVGWKEDGSPAKFIIIEGAPGIGKTTFAWKLCRKWAKGIILTTYRLVVLLSLRDQRIREATTIFDLIYHSNTEIRRAVSRELEMKKGHSLFLLFEGYDELPGKLQKERSIFLDILCKNFLPEATVLVTSRPSATEFLHQTFREQISQHIEILGFAKEDIQSYIHSVMDDLQEDFTQYLKCYPYIRGMMYVPLNAVIVAEVYKTSRESPDKFIPTTMTELYTALTRGILLRYLFSHREYERSKWTLRKFSDLPKEIHKQFNKVCSIAFGGMIKDEFIFDDLPKEFDSLDLMQSSPELYVGQGALVSYNFFHLTLQEYLAAVHISHQRPEEQTEYFRGSFRNVLLRMLSPPSLHATTSSSVAPSQFDEDKTAQRLKNSLRFAAGVTKFENLPPDSLRSLLLNTAYKDEEISLDALHWLFEAQCIGKTISGITNLRYQHGRSMTPFDCFVLGHAVSHINCTWTVDLIDCDISNEDLEMLVTGMHFYKDSSPHSHLPVSLYLTNCDITREGLHYLTEMPEHVAASVTELRLGGNPIGGGGAHFFSKLPSLRSLKTLSIHSTKMTLEDTEAVSQFLSRPDSQHLKVLYLNNNSLTLEGTERILEALTKNSTLEELYLDDAYVCMENVSSLTAALKGNCGLMILRLDYCMIDSDTACEIASALCENSTLEELYMDGNPIGAQGAAALADMLDSNETILELRA